MKRALVCGLTGMDGSHLADLLLDKGYTVYGMVRRTSHLNTTNIRHLLDHVQIVYGDLTDSNSLNQVLQQVIPDEVYNLAAQSFVPTSWTHPELTAEVTGLGVMRLLNAILQLDAIRSNHSGTRLFQASSSEMFGDANTDTQDEDTPFKPNNPYGAAKLFAHNMVVQYRQHYGLHASCGIMFNHESERRSVEFVTRKVTQAAAKVHRGRLAHVRMGNLESRRDWGYAPDYMRAAWMMLQQDAPDDYVIATGISRSIADLCQTAFNAVGLDAKDYVVQDEALKRITDTRYLCGSSAKIRELVGWKPEVGFTQMIERMVQSDLKQLDEGSL